jgi:hypothetical protein
MKRKNNVAQPRPYAMRVSEGYQTVRPASGFVSVDTDAAPQSRTAGMASTVLRNGVSCENCYRSFISCIKKTIKSYAVWGSAKLAPLQFG